MNVKTITTTQYIDEDQGLEYSFFTVEGSLTVKKTKTGYEARYLVQDNTYESPDKWGNNDLFLVGYHRDFTVDPIKKDLAQAIANNGKNEYDEESEEAKRYIKEYHIFGLEAYIHSGVVLALSREGNFPDRQWDVSQFGLVFVSKKEWPTKDKARKAALSLIEEWNCALSGEVYGIVKETYNDKKEPLDQDSCWGFYGYKYALEALKTDI